MQVDSVPNSNSRSRSPQQTTSKKFTDEKCSSYTFPSEKYTSINSRNNINNKNKLRSSLTTALFDFSPEPLLDPWVKLAIDSWNKIPEQRTHRPGTKLYDKTVRLLEKLFDGSIFEFDNNGLQQYSRRKFTFDEFKQSLNNFLIACRSESHYPTDKTKYKKINLANWIYNPYSPYGTKSLFVKYLTPPKRIEAKSMTTVDSEKMLDEFQTLYPEKLQPAILDQVKQSLNKLHKIWKKMPDQFTHTTLPDNLGQREMVRLLFDFANNIAQYFNPRLLSQPWFWTKFDNFLIEQGYFEE